MGKNAGKHKVWVWLGIPDPDFTMLLITDDQGDLYRLSFEGTLSRDEGALNSLGLDKDYWRRIA